MDRGRREGEADIRHVAGLLRTDESSYYVGIYSPSYAEINQEELMKSKKIAALGAACTLLCFVPLTRASASSDASQEFIRGTLTNCQFGSAANVQIQTGSAGVTVLAVNDSSKFTLSGSSNVILSSFAQTATNRKVFAVGRKENGAWLLIAAWDEGAFDSFCTSALSAGGGYIKSCPGKMIKLGDYYYSVDKSTKFIKGGKISKGINVFSDNSMVHISAELKKGVPHALVVSDSQSDTGQASAGNSRPEAAGKGRPDSANSGKPTKSPSERGAVSGGQSGNSRPTPANSGKGGKANSRPDSRGASGSKGGSPSERASKPKYKITLFFKVKLSIDELRGVAGNVVDTFKDGYSLEDKKQELFGSLTIDGKQLWSIPEKQAKDNQYEQGSKLHVKPKAKSPYHVDGNIVVQASSIKLSGSLMDFDAIGKADELIKVNKTINLEQLVGKSDAILQVGEGADIWIKVESAD